MKSEDYIRLEVEKQVDEFIKSPSMWEDLVKIFLSEANIPPSSNAILSMILGITYGYVYGETEKEYKRKLTAKENQLLRNIIQRRASEIRENIILNRYR